MVVPPPWYLEYNIFGWAVVVRKGGRVKERELWHACDILGYNGFIVRSLGNVVKDEDERALCWREL